MESGDAFVAVAARLPSLIRGADAGPGGVSFSRCQPEAGGLNRRSDNIRNHEPALLVDCRLKQFRDSLKSEGRKR
jgi:hypothetical protein